MKTMQDIIKENIEKYQVAIMSQRANDMTKACMEAWADQEKAALKEKLDDAVAVLKKLNRAINQSNMKSTILHSEVRKVLRDNKVTPE